MATKTYGPKYMMKVLGVTRSTYDNWKRQKLIVAKVDAEGAGTKAEYSIHGLKMALIVQKLKKIRIDLAVAHKISQTLTITGGKIWYDIESSEHGTGKPPEATMLLIIDHDKIAGEVKEKIKIVEEEEKREREERERKKERKLNS